jgi:hypothetical protein
MITIHWTGHPETSDGGPMTELESKRLDRLQQAAEEVRSHLVVLRGGAPFLSPLDGRLLLEWLEAGIGVPAILRALEVAAAKRREKRVRTPLSLRSVRSRVQKSRTPSLPPESAGLEELVGTLDSSDDPWVRQAARDLAELQGTGDDLARQALQIIRQFHEEDWRRADRASLLALATAELVDLREKLSDKQWSTALEEVARDTLRARHPLLSATAIWDSLSL